MEFKNRGGHIGKQRNLPASPHPPARALRKFTRGENEQEVPSQPPHCGQFAAFARESPTVVNILIPADGAAWSASTSASIPRG